MTLATTALRYKAFWMLAAVMGFSLVFSPVAQASETNCDDLDQTTDPFGITCVDRGLDLGNQDIRVTISSIINVALSLLGIVAVVIILIGGFQWMTAGGNEDKVAGARKMIFAGIIGLAIILSAFAIASFVLTNLQTATDYGGDTAN